MGKFGSDRMQQDWETAQVDTGISKRTFYELVSTSPEDHLRKSKSVLFLSFYPTCA
jgi:hypothetical protein